MAWAKALCVLFLYQIPWYQLVAWCLYLKEEAADLRQAAAMMAATAWHAAKWQ